MRFVDTNVLIYAVSTADGEQTKRHAAHTIFRGQELGLSVQVLQEFYVQATRPTRLGALTHEQAEAIVTGLLRFPIAVTTPDVMRAAIATSQRYQIPYWDAAIIEAARTLGCDVVLSEDLGNGQDFGGVRVHNPFVDPQ